MSNAQIILITNSYFIVAMFMGTLNSRLDGDSKCMMAFGLFIMFVLTLIGASKV